MATSKKSLAARAGSVVRRAVLGRADEGAAVAETPEVTAAAAKKAPAKKAPAKKAPAKKAPAVTVPAEKAAAKAPAKKAPAKKAPAKKAPAKKAPKKKAVAEKAPATKAPAKKASTTPPAPVTKKAPVTKAPAKKATTKAPAKKAASKASTTSSAAGGRGAAALVVREGEDPWTEAELEEVREHLRGDIERLGAELQQADTGLHDLMVDSGDGSGQDQADLGSSSFERGHEITIANNARDMLDQSQHALERIENGSYGVCERNEEPIGKLRLMAFPRATLCMPCKQREERR